MKHHLGSILSLGSMRVELQRRTPFTKNEHMRSQLKNKLSVPQKSFQKCTTSFCCCNVMTAACRRVLSIPTCDFQFQCDFATKNAAVNASLKALDIGINWTLYYCIAPTHLKFLKPTLRNTSFSLASYSRRLFITRRWGLVLTIIGQTLWLSWQSNRFQYQRSVDQIESSASFYKEHLFTVNCIDKTCTIEFNKLKVLIFSKIWSKWRERERERERATAVFQD